VWKEVSDIFRGTRYSGVDNHVDEFLHEFRERISAPTATVARVLNSAGELTGFAHAYISSESRVEFALKIAKDLGNREAERLVDDLIEALTNRWKEGVADKEDLVRLVQALAERKPTESDLYLKAARQCLFGSFDDMPSFLGVARFVNTYPGVVSGEELDRARKEFKEFASSWDREWDSAEYYRDDAGDFEFVGQALGVDVSDVTASLYQSADEIESEQSEEVPDDDDRSDWRPFSTVKENVDDMFQSLRSDLED
jgi:hypothetical protein